MYEPVDDISEDTVLLFFILRIQWIFVCNPSSFLRHEFWQNIFETGTNSITFPYERLFFCRTKFLPFQIVCQIFSSSENVRYLVRLNFLLRDEGVQIRRASCESKLEGFSVAFIREWPRETDSKSRKGGHVERIYFQRREYRDDWIKRECNVFVYDSQLLKLPDKPPQ